MDVDVIVIGAGPAGLSAALMLGRSRRSVLVLDDGRPRNRSSAHMHGVLGHDGDTPQALGERGRAEARRYDVRFRAERVTRSASGDHEDVIVATDSGVTHRARALVVASGVSDELPEIPGLAERWSATVLHCPYCHGWEVRDQRLGVLLTSPAGLHQAELARQLSDRVTVFANGIEVDAAARRRLAARDVPVVDGAVSAVEGDDTMIVRLEGFGSWQLDALFTAGIPRPHDAAVAGLDLRRVDGLLEVDALHRTSHPRVWACGNAVLPVANVPLSMGDGSMTGAAVNAALTAEDFERADAGSWPAVAPADYWDDRYRSAQRIWSGRVNATFAETLSQLGGGEGRTALDLGCGEGADVLWLAEHGWHATGVDISEVAVGRARDAAAQLHLDAEFETADLSTWRPAASVDLVTASFLHSTVELPRDDILRRAAGWVAPGGHLLLVAHAAPPPWAHAHHHAGFPTPDAELRTLDLDPAAWRVVCAEERERDTIGPDGQPARLRDGVVLVQRISAFDE